jgi:hypothetical protein
MGVDSPPTRDGRRPVLQLAFGRATPGEDLVVIPGPKFPAACEPAPEPGVAYNRQKRCNRLLFGLYEQGFRI